MIEKKGLTDNDLKKLLGTIRVPVSIEAFRSGLQTKHGNIIRRRHDFSVDEIPFRSETIPWYALGNRPTENTYGPTRTLAYASGAYFVQDAGSLLALALCDADRSPTSPLLICDLCAAPGAKASALLEMIEQSQGFLLANEVIGTRVPSLTSNLSRTGSNRFAVSSLDPTVLAKKLGSVFDIVLVDAPCSGQAMLSKGKQRESSFSQPQVEHSALRQQRILDAASQLIVEGGTLVYSTCTFAEAENEDQVDRLLKSGMFEPARSPRLEEYETSSSCYRLWPHLHQCAGAFASRLKIKNVHNVSVRPRKIVETRVSDAPLKDWYVDDFRQCRLRQAGGSLFAWSNNAPHWVESIAVNGPEIAHRTGQTWKPSHAGALRGLTEKKANQNFALDKESTKQYLRGETIKLNAKGWGAVSYGGRPLGWVKAMNGIAKNHLPSHARFSGNLAD